MATDTFEVCGQTGCQMALGHRGDCRSDIPREDAPRAEAQERSAEYRRVLDHLIQIEWDADRLVVLQEIRAHFLTPPPGAASPAEEERPRGLKLDLSREWCERMAKLEEEHGGDITVGGDTLSTPPTPAAGETWQPIATAPKMRTILLFAVTDVDEHGRVLNWKKATGFWHTGYDDARSKATGYTPWNWEGHQLKLHDHQPTHWMPLPASPQDAGPGETR